MSRGADDSLPKTKFCEKHYYYYVNYHKKRSADGEGAGCSATGPAEEIRGSKRRKKVKEEDNETEMQPPTSDNTCSDTILEGGTGNIRRKRENVERTERSGEPVVELESLELYKSKCIELSAELEMKKVECTKLQGELLDFNWRKMFSDLESRVLRMENSNSTMAECVESRISILESLVFKSGKESSILRCVDLRDSGKIDSKARGLQTKEEVLDMYRNFEEGKGWGCSEERQFQHGSSSQAHLKISKKPFVNLVSDDSGESLGKSEDSDTSADSKASLGELMDMMAMKYRNRNIDSEIKWEFEADMVSSFEEDPELCMKAVCALYRQHISEDEISAKGLFHYTDALRTTTLAKFLMDGAYEGDLKKSVKELEKFDSKAVEDCKRLARSNSKQLFRIYQNGKDPYFLPTTTASHGDQTAK